MLGLSGGGSGSEPVVGFGDENGRWVGRNQGWHGCETGKEGEWKWVLAVFFFVVSVVVGVVVEMVVVVVRVVEGCVEETSHHQGVWVL